MSVDKAATGGLDVKEAVKNIESGGGGGGCNDPLWVVLFLGQFGFMMYTGLDAISWFVGAYARISSVINMNSSDLENLIGYCILGIMIAMAYALCWILFMKALEGNVIYVSVVLLLITQHVMPMVLYGDNPLMTPYLVWDALFLLILFCNRSVIPLVEAFLANALQVLSENWCPIGISYFFVVLNTAVQGIYCFAFISLLLKMVPDMCGEGKGCTGPSEVEIFLMYVSYAWARNTIKNIVHFIIAGVTASWALLGSDAPSPTTGALKRAVTSSFGSCAYAALVSAIFQGLKWMIEMGPGCCGLHAYTCPCFLSCCLTAIDETIKAYNVFSLSECAVYGFSYCEGVKRFSEVLVAKGMTVITAAVLIYIPIMVCMNTGAFLVWAMLLEILDKMFNQFWPENMGAFILVVVPMTLIAYIIGMSVVEATTCMVDSAYATIIVCWAEDPASFSTQQTEQFNKIIDAVVAEGTTVAKMAEDDKLRGLPEGSSWTTLCAGKKRDDSVLMDASN